MRRAERGQGVMASSTDGFQNVLTVSPFADRHTATVIFLHGAGDTGHGVCEWIKSRTVFNGFHFRFPHIKILFPTAPLRHYTPCKDNAHIWLNWERIDKSLAEDLDSIDAGISQVTDLIDNEVKSGIPLERIVLGGLSMGGVMSLHVAFRKVPQMPAVFGLSTTLYDNSCVYQVVSSGGKLPELYMAHGTNDALIPCRWGQETFDQLHKAGIRGSFRTYPNLAHDMCFDELRDLHQWIYNILPDI